MFLHIPRLHPRLKRTDATRRYVIFPGGTPTIIISPESVNSRNCWRTPKPPVGANINAQARPRKRGTCRVGTEYQRQQMSLDAMIDRDIASWLTTYRNSTLRRKLSHREGKDFGPSSQANYANSDSPSRNALESIKTSSGWVTASLV
jgi:hypothetical protein